MGVDTSDQPKMEMGSAAAPRRRPAVILLSALLVLLALVSIPPGISLLLDPTGSGMAMQPFLPVLTQALPFIHDFVLLGLWLLVVYGAVPVVLAAGVWLSRTWARNASMLLGAVVVVWIGIELVMFSAFGFTWLYPLIGGIGAVVLVLSLPPTLWRSIQRRDVLLAK